MNDVVDIKAERDLNVLTKQLATEEPMENDIWPNIRSAMTEKSNISQQNSSSCETKFYTAKWIPWAIAASLLISLFSLTISWEHLDLSQAAVAKLELNQNKTGGLVDNNQFELDNSVKYQVQMMEKQYLNTKERLLKNLSYSGAAIDAVTLAKIKASLIDIQSASTLVKNAIDKQPNDSQLPLLLNSIYQKELKVLSQIVMLEGRI